MRNAFAAELEQLAAEDDRVVLLSGDIGNRLFDKYKERAPGRFFNCGVAEANMVGVAAGLALSGMRPVTYTITSFMTTRCLEQIRVDVCYHKAPVVIVGTGSGLSYAELGVTHHSCEDVALLSALPNLAVVCPGDPTEVRLALRAALASNGPVYLRLGKKGEPTIHAGTPNFEIGKAIPVREGKDVCILSTGSVLGIAMQAAEGLEREGLSTRVVSHHTVKPLDEDLLRDVLGRFGLVVTLEEHSLRGGFGGAVAEWSVDHGPHQARLLRIGVPNEFYHEVGNHAWARKRLGLTPEAVVSKVLHVYAVNRR